MSCLQVAPPTDVIATHPDEFFYQAHSAELDQEANGFGVRFEQAVEGAYLNGDPKDGDQMVFQRTRILIHCPNTFPTGVTCECIDVYALTYAYALRSACVP